MGRFFQSSNSLPQYLLALLFLGGATTLLFLLRDVLGTPLIALLFLLVVGLSTAFWGLAPGILTAFIAFLAFNFLFVIPYYTFNVYHTRDVLMLLVFLIVAVVLSQLVGRAQAGMALATAREREATKLYELSTALAGMQSGESIARVVADQLLNSIAPDFLELSIDERSNSAGVILVCPPHASLPQHPADLSVPLQTARGRLGEIRLWKPAGLTEVEQRLLKTMVSQGAIALERSWLDEAETRAKVIEESEHLKTALLSSVSHELRSPLSTIKASITSLRSGEVDWASPAREDLLAAVDEEADHLNRLVGNLLDMSRIESGALKPKREWNLLAEIIGNVRAHMRLALTGCDLMLDLPEDLPLVPVDFIQMEQVFTNLIGNSLKYAPPGSTIGLHARKQNNSSLLVQVTNQSPPVPEEHLDRIFDKFYRVTAADRVTGTGLGLSICRGIIEAHGGRIWAENTTSGFAFKFTLPLNWVGTPPPHLPLDADLA